MPGKNIHVVPAGDGWAIEHEGGGERQEFERQEDAIMAGTAKAQQEKVELLIHGRDGQFGSAIRSATIRATSRDSPLDKRPNRHCLPMLSTAPPMANREGNRSRRPERRSSDGIDPREAKDQAPRDGTLAGARAL